MYEVEMKVRAEHTAVRDRLREVDATQVAQVRQVDTYYDAPDREFAATDEALRVRREHREGEDTTLLTYKGPLVDQGSKTRAEAETPVTDEEAMRHILEGLGYEPAATVEKERDRYEFGECRITLDLVTDLGEFVEVEYAGQEAVTSEAAIDAARDQARGVLERLGLDPADQIRTSYLGLLLASEGA